MRVGQLSIFFVCSLLLTACSSLFAPAAVPTIQTYRLDPTSVHIAKSKKSHFSLLIQMPNMNPGFRTQRMVYVEDDFSVGYFSTNQWAGSPADMLMPLLSQALQKTNHYTAVVTPPFPSFVDLELDTHILSLYQDFRKKPSQIHLRITAQLLDRRTSTVIASRDFVVNEKAPTDTPYGGVIAANRAIAKFLTQLSQFCIQHDPDESNATIPKAFEK